MLTLSFVTGTEPDKWFDRYRERTDHELMTQSSEDPIAELLAGRTEAALVRLPDPRLSADPERWHRVILYEEAPGVAVPKDSLFAELGDSVEAADLNEEILNYRPAANGVVDVAATREALRIVAANVGIVLGPRPLLKVLSGRQVIPLGFHGDLLPTQIALVWERARDADDIQDFVGITRGRTPNSSRQAAPRRRRKKR